jgi:hypothetical protein
MSEARAFARAVLRSVRDELAPGKQARHIIAFS